MLPPGMRESRPHQTASVRAAMTSIPVPATADRRIRQRVLEAGISLLAERGLAGELLEDAARMAGCPLDRAQVFFNRDEDLVLALYARLAAELEARVAELPESDLAERFRKIMLAKLALVSPHRRSAFR